MEANQTQQTGGTRELRREKIREEVNELERATWKIIEGHYLPATLTSSESKMLMGIYHEINRLMRSIDNDVNISIKKDMALGATATQ